MLIRDYTQMLLRSAADVSGAAAPAATETPAPVAEAAAPDAKVETPADPPSLLEAAPSNLPAGAKDGEPAKDATKQTPESKDAAASKDAPAPADAAKPEGDKAKPETKSEAKPDAKPEAKGEGEKDAAKATDPAKDATAHEPPAPIKYEAFKTPDGIKLDDGKLAQFSEIAGAAQVKQEDAQKLVDLYVDAVQELNKQASQHQRDVWSSLNDSWKEELRKDPNLGGNRLETSLAMAKAVIEEYGGSKEQVADYLRHITANGMGNFIGHVRLLHNIGAALNIFENGIVPANPKPPSVKGSRGSRWYKDSMGNGAAAS
jgi:hypothetical protein